MDYIMTLRRRKPDGSLEETKFKVSPIGDSEADVNDILMIDLELQANSSGPVAGSDRHVVRTWVEHLNAVEEPEPVVVTNL